MAQYTSEQVIAAYVRILKELAKRKWLMESGPSRFPEEFLPLPKAEMVTLFQRSTHPDKEMLLGSLRWFGPITETRDIFYTRFIVLPALLALVYAVAIAVQGASWWWVLVAFLGAVGASFIVSKLYWVDAYETLPKWKRWCWVLLIELGEIAECGCWSAVWVRLVIISGLYGLYQSVWVRFDGFGAFAAVLSILLGYVFSKQCNSLYFFLVQYMKRRQFRGHTIAAA